jgi:hypothetical protein
MMGKQQPREAKLFYYGLSLGQRIPRDHLLRKVQTMVDFDFTYALVQKHYGVKGNVSVPPPVLLKLLLLLFLYDVPSERELMRSLRPTRADQSHGGPVALTGTAPAQAGPLRDRAVPLRSQERHLSLSGRPDAQASQTQETASGLRVRLPCIDLSGLSNASSVHASQRGRTNGQAALCPGGD